METNIEYYIFNGPRGVSPFSIQEIREDFGFGGDVGIVLFSSLCVGPYIDTLVSFTGMDRDFVIDVLDNCWLNGIWTHVEGEDVLACDWSTDTIFVADCLVAEGKVKREFQDGDFLYSVRTSDSEKEEL